MDNNESFTPVEHFYKSRENFTIIGLTGLAGSGCSTLAKIIANENFIFDETSVRKPEDLIFECKTSCSNANLNEDTDNIKSTSQLVFKRKYTICHDFVKKQYKPYLVIKYTKVVLLFTLIYAKEKLDASSGDLLRLKIIKMMSDKYFPSQNPNVDIDYRKEKGYEIGRQIEVENINSLDWNSLFLALCTLNSSNYIDSLSQKQREKTDYESLSKLFFENKVFNDFYDKFVDELTKQDYYSLNFMFHRLTACIRNCGDPFKLSKENFEQLNKQYDHLYDIVKFINYIIKGENRERRSRRFVIDSIRNSMEALYLKERYTAFYLIAVHDDEHRDEHFKEKVSKTVAPTLIGQQEKARLIELMCNSLRNLMDIETKTGDFEKGKFHSPNVGQCIADAEIHISNVPEIKLDASSFYTMAEQWMKYAALILHPGLITPSSEERCMIVAYSAKFNSGCLSRQVGACITNQYHTIRTIGWNDVPYGQIPCSLRELGDIKKPTLISRTYRRYMYSQFERGTQNIYDENKYSFIQKVDDDYSDIDSLKEKLKGLPLSFCFKTLQNRYEGEKNQVYTRSLHAEENAMMQMVKYGGESLMNGIIYVTASPCELCSKKLYQMGVRKIVYIDPYPGISRKQIIACGFKRPFLKLFQGAYGSSYYKLYQPFMSYKDEISIRTSDTHEYKSNDDLLKDVLKEIGGKTQVCYTQKDYDNVLASIKELKKKADEYEKEHQNDKENSNQ